MSGSQEDANRGSFPTSEVGCGTRNRSGGDIACDLNVTEQCASVSDENLSAREAPPPPPPPPAPAAAASMFGDAGALLQLLRGLAGAPTLVPLIKFDPDDPDADVEGWCKINEVIIKHKDLKGDFVFLKCCERNQTKLDRKFKGPFKITEVLENDRYELQHVDGSKRIFKYPHESLRKVPEGREGLTEMAEALCNQALDSDETVSADSCSEMEVDDEARDSIEVQVHHEAERGAVVDVPAGVGSVNENTVVDAPAGVVCGGEDGAVAQ